LRSSRATLRVAARPTRGGACSWYARIAVAVALAAGVIELALACHGAVTFGLWAVRGREPADEVVTWFVAMFLVAPSFALVALGWFTLFTARAARRGIEDGYLGMSAALVLSLGVVHYVAPPPWVAGAVALAVVAGATASFVAWRRVSGLPRPGGPVPPDRGPAARS
jgi:heme/copper-type cytochrome/quinol oxidase subunit 2